LAQNLQSGRVRLQLCFSIAETIATNDETQ
jgi:hypothetical protein